MFPWKMLRAREQHSGRSKHRAILAQNMYDEGLKDVNIELENNERMWWNAVLTPERPRAVQRRALLIRQCQLEIDIQRKKSNIGSKKRPRDDAEPLVYDEIVID